MTSVSITPSKATTIIRLPSEFSAAWSPGFDLHVTGSGPTEEEARKDLVGNLRVLSSVLAGRALEIERGET